MREIETKFLNIDRTQIEPKILAMGGEIIYEGEVLGRYYDTSDKKLRRNQSSLRLRHKEDTGEVNLTGKKKIILPSDYPQNMRVRACEEWESLRTQNTDNFENTHDMLIRLLGYQHTFEVRKHRTTYELDYDLGRIEIDEIIKPIHVPTLLEIEGPMGKEHQQKPIIDIARIIANTASRIGLRMEDARGWSTLHVIEDQIESLRAMIRELRQK